MEQTTVAPNTKGVANYYIKILHKHSFILSNKELTLLAHLTTINQTNHLTPIQFEQLEGLYDQVVIYN